MGNFYKELFTPLYQLLFDYKVDAIEELEKLSKSNIRALYGRVALFFKDNLNIILQIIENSEGVVLNFDNYNAKWNNTNKIAKKSVFYSDISVVLLEETIKIGFEEPLIKSPLSKRKMISKKVRSGGLKQTIEVLLQIKPLVLKGILIPIPANIEFVNEEESIPQNVKIKYHRIIEKIKRGDMSCFTLPVSLDRWQIRRQIEETVHFRPALSGLSPINIYLPYLSNIDLDTLIGLREDNYEIFQRYQQSLKNFLVSSPNLNSENAFLEIARKIDFEIETLSIKVKEMASQRNRRGWEIGIGIGVSALTLLVDIQFAKYIAGIIGSKSVFDGITYLTNNQNNIQNQDYYMAFLTHKESTNKL